MTGIGASTGQYKLYSLAVPAGQTTLTFTTSGGTGDSDLYVKSGSAPTLTSYDCRPYASGNAETCTFNNPVATTWYVMLNAYATFSGVSLTGTYGTGGGGGGTVLSNGVPVTGLGAATGAALNYTMAVPSGASNLSFAISGGTGDADLYVKFGSAPTTTSYDCRPYIGGNAETCSFATPQVGTYYVMVRAFSTFSGVTLLGQYGTGGGGGGTFSNGDFESGLAPWTASGFASRQTTGTAHGGVAFAQVGGTDSGSGAISQSFTVPSTGNTARFWIYTTTQETTTTTAYDHLYVEVVNSAGTVLGTLAHYTNLDKNTAYAQKSFSLAAWAGQTVSLRFRGTSDISLPTVFRVDDVTVSP